MTTVVFDLGGVVVVWDPVPAIAAVVGQERAEHFVHGGEFDFASWNHAQDAGRSWKDAEAVATASHPELAEEIAAYRPNFALSLRELVPGTVGILRALHDRCIRLVALTNWSAETIHHGVAVFPEVFALFDDVIVSGAEGVAKPQREIFQVLTRRLGHPIDGVFYVDDNLSNVEAARSAGMDAVHFTDAATLLQQLQGRRLLDEPGSHPTNCTCGRPR
ncbi:MAG: HAD family hydrolase [Nocardioidaceae bacterium]